MENTDINEPITFPVDEAADKPMVYHVPAGSYALTAWTVERGTSQKGDTKLNIKFGINGQGGKIWVYHNITLLPKDSPGHGIAIHALKTLGFAIDKSIVNFRPVDIIGRVCRADLIVIEKEATSKAGNPYLKQTNGIKTLQYAKAEDKPEMAPVVAEKEGFEPVPF